MLMMSEEDFWWFILFVFLPGNKMLLGWGKCTLFLQLVLFFLVKKLKNKVAILIM